MTVSMPGHETAVRNPAAPGDIGTEDRVLQHVRPRDLAVRFAFGAAVSVLAGVVGLATGHAPGGLFLAFPAILPAALTLIESREGTSRAVSETRGAVVGATAMVGFACVVLALVGRLPAVVALLVATIAWLSLAIGLYVSGVRVASLLGEQVYLPDIAAGEVQPAVEAIRSARTTLAVAESCTGGTLSALLTAVPGASDVVRGGVVAYTNDVKIDLLGVPADLIRSEGAISDRVAVAMARGVCHRLSAGVGLAITGNGATESEGKPPGLAYVCAVGPQTTRVESIRSEGGDEVIRAEAVRTAIRLCIEVACQRATARPQVK